MAEEKSHVSWSFLLSLAYAGFGLISIGMHWELVLLASILFIIGGVLPNVDSTDEGLTGELSGVFGALLPVLLLEKFPELKGGSVRIALTLLFGYILARSIFSFLTTYLFSPRGALHSIPAIILFFEIGYLLFPDLYWKEKIYLGGALGLGVAFHILIDSFTNLSVVKKTVAKNAHSGSVMKFSGNTPAATWFLYICIIVFGWFVAKDLAPSLRVQAPIQVDQRDIQDKY